MPKIKSEPDSSTELEQDDSYEFLHTICMQLDPCMKTHAYASLYEYVYPLLRVHQIVVDDSVLNILHQ